MNNLTMQVSPEVQELGLRGNYFVISGMEFSRTTPEVDGLVREAVEEVKASWSAERVAEDPILQGFRALHEAVDRGGKKNVASPEGLFLTVLSAGDLPRINVAVDLYNVVSLRSRLALGAHDVGAIDGNVELRLSDGSERFVPLGRDKPKGLGPGEYIYADGANDVICRMETRQVEKTKVTTDTRDCFYIVQGNSETPSDYIDSVASELISLTVEHCGGEAHNLAAVK